MTFPGGRFSPHDENERARFAAYALYRRAAGATTIRAHATDLLTDDGQHQHILDLGDLNDEPEAATTQILRGPPGSEIGTDGYSVSDRGDRQRLWNLAPRIPEANRYSRIYRDRPELTDHILASHAITAHTTDGDISFHGPRPDSKPTTPTPTATNPAPTTGPPTHRRYLTGSGREPRADCAVFLCRCGRREPGDQHRSTAAAVAVS